MGLITRTIDQDSDLTVFTVVEDVDAKQILGEVLGFLTGEPTHFVLWDIRAGSLTRVTTAGLRLIAERATELADRRRGGRTAIVCSTDVDYGLSRMFQTFAELLQAPVEFTVSKDIASAREWLYGFRSDRAYGR
jgi:hypothetical protein